MPPEVQKTCSRCGVTKPVAEFPMRVKSGPNGSAFMSHCKTCWNVWLRDVYYADPNKRAAANAVKKRHRLKLRKEVLAHYGAVCNCCGETIEGFLTIDHIEGDGRKHREEIGTDAIYRWLKKNNYPTGFQVLCFNCNDAKRNKAVCPHQLNKAG